MRVMCIWPGWIVFVGLLLPIPVRAQAIDEIWKMRESVTLDGLLSDWSATSETCGAVTSSGKVGGLATVIIYKIVTPRPGEQGPTNYVIVLKSNNQDGNETGYAKVGRLYCIKQSALRDNLSPQEPAIAGGVLSVPFKLRLSPTKVMAGGALGGFIGHNIRHTKDIASMPLVFASLTNIPLNDMNDKVPQTQWGLGIGAGWVLTIPNNFQVGVAFGWDIFSWPDDWPYKKSPWLSISVGYSFISPQKQDSAKAAAMAVQ